MMKSRRSEKKGPLGKWRYKLGLLIKGATTCATSDDLEFEAGVRSLTEESKTKSSSNESVDRLQPKKLHSDDRFHSSVYGNFCMSSGDLDTLDELDSTYRKRYRSRPTHCGLITDLSHQCLVRILEFCDPYEILDLGLVSARLFKASVDAALWEMITRSVFLDCQIIAQPVYSNEECLWRTTFFVNLNRERIFTKGIGFSPRGKSWILKNEIMEIERSVPDIKFNIDRVNKGDL